MQTSAHVSPEPQVTTKEWKIKHVLLILITVVFLEICVWTTLSYLTSRMKVRARRALASARKPTSDRLSDSGAMLPPGFSRVYQIQAITAPREDSIISAIRDVQAQMKESKETLPSNLDTGDVEDILDFAFRGFYLKGHTELLSVEQWLVTRIGSSADGDLFVSDVHDAIKKNYYTIAEESQQVGLIEDAKRLYERYVLLTHYLSQENREISNSLQIQRDLTKSQVFLKVLAKEHVFRTQALNDLSSIDEETHSINESTIRSYLRDPDLSIRALAIFTLASNMYQSGKYLECIAFLQAYHSDWGVLTDECEFMLAKSYARNGFSSLETIPEHGRSALLEAQQRFNVLAERLPQNSYLKDDAYVWSSIIAGESGDTQLALSILQQTLSLFPNSDRRTSIEDSLMQYESSVPEAPSNEDEVELNRADESIDETGGAQK